jgi:hypothetical protein
MEHLHALPVQRVTTLLVRQHLVPLVTLELLLLVGRRPAPPVQPVLTPPLALRPALRVLLVTMLVEEPVHVTPVQLAPSPLVDPPPVLHALLALTPPRGPGRVPLARLAPTRPV